MADRVCFPVTMKTKTKTTWHLCQSHTWLGMGCLQNSEWLFTDQHILKVHYPKFRVSEDCLYLNIYAPAHAESGSKLPVMVWLPGGAFETGSASIFDGSALASYENVLVVIIQYRLGIFGFFNTGDEHARGNWAFMDQVAALIWVQENIEFFGGDPHCVTIFGESAGAISVSSLILSPMTKGLFHRAIMESGVAIIPYLKAPDYERNGDLQTIASICDCNASDSMALLQCLRAKSSKELLRINQKTKSFTRVVDGLFFPNEPLDLLAQKLFHLVPSIIGVNNHECGFLLPMKEFPEILGGSNKSLALQLIHSVLHIPVQYLYLVANEYFHNKHSLVDIRNRFLDLLGDVFFVIPGLVTAQYHTDAGAPVYFYEFQHRPQCLKDRKPPFVKADHTDEIRFVFGGAFLKGNIVMFEDQLNQRRYPINITVLLFYKFTSGRSHHFFNNTDNLELLNQIQTKLETNQSSPVNFLSSSRGQQCKRGKNFPSLRAPGTQRPFVLWTFLPDPPRPDPPPCQPLVLATVTDVPSWQRWGSGPRPGKRPGLGYRGPETDPAHHSPVLC
ncbi:carboxylesterase 5A isoform X3 [Moschus berezovskii]|uniref:carboxylesterase 5A isoform X3 n=1 Tax=Moschus berezovskii TaxID=68408 RepID=UPI002444E9A7|nr:carboxylesterase 5A isoform X3 [Moschus berezovskii]